MRLSSLLRQTSFRQQMNVSFAACVAMLAIFLSLAGSWQGSSHLRDMGIAQGQRVAENLASQSKLALLYESAANTVTTVGVTLAFPDVIQVEIRDAAGRAVVDTGTEDIAHDIDADAGKLLPVLHLGRSFVESESDKVWRFVAPVVAVREGSPLDGVEHTDELLGYVRIVQSKDTLIRTRLGIFAANLGVSFVLTLVFLLVVRLLTARLTRPLGDLASAMKRAKQGETDVQARIDGPKDIVHMAQIFNSMMLVLHDRERELLQARDGAMHSARINADLASTVSRVNAELETDIAARLKAEAEVRVLNAELEQRVMRRTAELEAANHELDAFSYSVSHDLRAPLRRIEGFGELLIADYADRLDERGRHYIDRMRAGSHDLAEMIDSFLKLSRSTRGELVVERIDLSVLARDIIGHLRDRSPERCVSVEIHSDMAVEGDRRLLKIALENLLDNAWKYTRLTADAAISFGVSAEDGQCVYSVRDNGTGFDMRYAERLFTPFVRLHRQEQFEGTGIGLVTVQRVIARHGGRVWITAEPGKGATIYFTLWEGRRTNGEI